MLLFQCARFLHRNKFVVQLDIHVASSEIVHIDSQCKFLCDICPVRNICTQKLICIPSACYVHSCTFSATCFHLLLQTTFDICCTFDIWHFLFVIVSKTNTVRRSTWELQQVIHWQILWDSSCTLCNECVVSHCIANVGTALGTSESNWRTSHDLPTMLAPVCGKHLWHAAPCSVYALQIGVSSHGTSTKNRPQLPVSYVKHAYSTVALCTTTRQQQIRVSDKMLQLSVVCFHFSPGTWTGTCWYEVAVENGLHRFMMTSVHFTDVIMKTHNETLCTEWWRRRHFCSWRFWRQHRPQCESKITDHIKKSDDGVKKTWRRHQRENPFSFHVDVDVGYGDADVGYPDDAPPSYAEVCGGARYDVGEEHVWVTPDLTFLHGHGVGVGKCPSGIQVQHDIFSTNGRHFCSEWKRLSSEWKCLPVVEKIQYSNWGRKLLLDLGGVLFCPRKEEAVCYDHRRVFVQGETLCHEGHFLTPTPAKYGHPSTSNWNAPVGISSILHHVEGEPTCVL